MTESDKKMKKPLIATNIETVADLIKALQRFPKRKPIRATRDELPITEVFVTRNFRTQQVIAVVLDTDKVGKNA